MLIISYFFTSFSYAVKWAHNICFCLLFIPRTIILFFFLWQICIWILLSHFYFIFKTDRIYKGHSFLFPWIQLIWNQIFISRNKELFHFILFIKVNNTVMNHCYSFDLSFIIFCFIFLSFYYSLLVVIFI